MSAIVSARTLNREARREARDAQDAHRSSAKASRHVAQHLVLEVVPPPWNGSTSVPSSALRDGIDREVAALEVLFERDVGRGVDDEAVVAAAALALGARERVLLVRLRMQEDREVACPPGL